MNSRSFSEAIRLVELHVSVHRPIDMTWWEWTGLLQARMASLGACYGERPPVELARMFAADAVSLLAAVIEAEDADPAVEDLAA